MICRYLEAPWPDSLFGSVGVHNSPAVSVNPLDGKSKTSFLQIQPASPQHRWDSFQVDFIGWK